MNEVAAGVSRFEPRGVDRRQRHATFATHDLLDGLVQQLGNRRCPQEALGGFLKGGEVRHLDQFDGVAPGRRVLQVSDQSPVIGPQKGLEHEAREQLMLGKLLRAGAVTVRGQYGLRTFQAVTSTVLGDLHVLLIPPYTHNNHLAFSVFYRAGQNVFLRSYYDGSGATVARRFLSSRYSTGGRPCRAPT